MISLEKPLDCPLCQQPHTNQLQDELCKIRLQIINLKLREREILRELATLAILALTLAPPFVALWMA